MATSGKSSFTDLLSKLSSTYISPKQKSAYNNSRKKIEEILKKEPMSPESVSEATKQLDELAKILSTQDQKNRSIKSEKEIISKIRKRLVGTQNAERGIPPRITGQALRPKETPSFNPETSWLVTAISSFIKWLKEDIEIDINIIKKKCPDTLKEVQTDLLYFRDELTRRFSIVRQKEHEKTECLKSLLKFINDPSLAHEKVPRKGVFIKDPDETIMEDIKQAVRKISERSPNTRDQKMLDSKQRLNTIRDNILKFGPVSQTDFNKGPEEDIILEIDKALNERHEQLLNIESKLKVMCGNDGSPKKPKTDDNTTPIERIQQIINNLDRSKVDVKNESSDRESYPRVIEKLEQCVESMTFDPKWFGKLKNDKDATIRTLGRIAEQNSKWAVVVKQVDTLEEDIRSGNIFEKTKNRQRDVSNETGIIYIRQRILRSNTKYQEVTKEITDLRRQVLDTEEPQSDERPEEQWRSDLETIRENISAMTKKLTKALTEYVEVSEVSEEVAVIEGILTAACTESSDVKIEPSSQIIPASNKPKDIIKSQLKSMVIKLTGIMDSQRDKIERQEEEITTLQQTLAEKNEGISNLEKSTEKLDGEKKDLLLRLSSVAGAKLVQDNPNIADLSDPNRPTKIAEKFREIYDSEWTDAYEALNTGKKTNEREICRQLVEILFDAEKFSNDMAEKQFTAICNSCCSPMESQAGDTKSKKENKNLDSTYRKLINDLRKQTGHISVQDVLQVSLDKEKSNLHPNVLKYKQKCVEICWYMSLQTPPVVLEQIPKEKTKFNRDRYTEYTKKGSQIDFVAWPPLLLHKDGPLLSKGVAQGK